MPINHAAQKAIYMSEKPVEDRPNPAFWRIDPA
jgi:hypothetical protein